MISLFLPLVSAIAYRLRGSAWFTNDSQMKGLRILKLLIGALPVGLAVLFSGVPLYASAAVTVAVLGADSLPHGAYQGVSNIMQGILLMANAVIAAVPPAVALFLFGHHTEAIVAIACSVLIAPSYYLGRKIPLSLQVGPVGFHQGPEIGEVIYGLTRVLFVLA